MAGPSNLPYLSQPDSLHSSFKLSRIFSAIMQPNGKKKKSLKYQDLTPTTTTPIPTLSDLGLIPFHPWFRKIVRILIYILILRFGVAHWNKNHHQDYAFDDPIVNTCLWFGDVCLYLCTCLDAMLFVTMIGTWSIKMTIMSTSVLIGSTFVCRYGHEAIGYTLLPSDEFWLHDQVSVCITLISCLLTTAATLFLFGMIFEGYFFGFRAASKKKKIKKKKNKKKKKKSKKIKNKKFIMI